MYYTKFAESQSSSFEEALYNIPSWFFLACFVSFLNGFEGLSKTSSFHQDAIITLLSFLQCDRNWTRVWPLRLVCIVYTMSNLMAPTLSWFQASCLRLACVLRVSFCLFSYQGRGVEVGILNSRSWIKCDFLPDKSWVVSVEAFCYTPTIWGSLFSLVIDFYMTPRKNVILWKMGFLVMVKVVVMMHRWWSWWWSRQWWWWWWREEEENCITIVLTSTRATIDGCVHIPGIILFIVINKKKLY